MSSHISQGMLRAVKYGVPVATGVSGLASLRVLYGQSRTQSPQRMQAPRKSSSGKAPGGRKARAGKALDCLA
jgi:hypothetical protein